MIYLCCVSSAQKYYSSTNIIIIAHTRCIITFVAFDLLRATPLSKHPSLYYLNILLQIVYARAYPHLSRDRDLSYLLSHSRKERYLSEPVCEIACVPAFSPGNCFLSLKFGVMRLVEVTLFSQDENHTFLSVSVYNLYTILKRGVIRTLKAYQFQRSKN